MIEEFLTNKGVEYEVIRHELAYTAQEAAAADHVSGYLFAKTVIVTDGERYFMLVLPAPHDVDMEKAGRMIGSDLRLATEREMGPLFPGCEVGAEPPFGSAFNMPTYVDAALTTHDNIVFRAGTHEKTIKMNCEDYLAVEEPTDGFFAVAS